MILFKKNEEKESTEKKYENEPFINLKPGKYIVTVKPLKMVQEDGKTPYLLVLFEKEKNEGHFEKFYLTDKSLDRLQYLHESCFKRSLEAEFSSYSELCDYFIQSFKHDTVKIGISLGGELSGDKLFTKLPFKYFASNIVGFQEEVFLEGTAKYEAVVKKTEQYNKKQNEEVYKKEEPVKPKEETIVKEDSDDGLPF